ncbi:MAG: polyphosphate polymerase domain-containing protein [Lachnospiraceae bacterium]|nr:polyphosphate polymerase domain-containing protein [Lachnospiraceae bacterium]
MAEIQHSFQRFEKKFILTPEQYEKLLPVLQERMDEEIYGLHTVCSVYYDTPTYALARASIEAPVYKEKFRLRSYGVPGSDDYIYAEIKKKYQGIVYKRRVEGRPGEILEFLDGKRELPHDEQIQSEIHYFMRSYRPVPKVFIAYDRRAFLGREKDGLRITFDWNIRWREEHLDLTYGDEGDPVLNEERIVMEVKIARAMPLWLSHLLSENQIYPNSFSKYGTCYKKYIASTFDARTRQNEFFTQGGTNDAEQYYDESDYAAASADLSGYSHGVGRADGPGVFV